MTQQNEQRARFDGEPQKPLPPAIAAQLAKGDPDKTGGRELPSAPYAVSNTVLSVAEAAGDMIAYIARGGMLGVVKHTPDILCAFDILRLRMDAAEEALTAHAEANGKAARPTAPEPGLSENGPFLDVATGA